MSKQLQLRGGTTSEHSTFTGAVREVTVDTDKDTLVVHDGSTAGGFPLLRNTVEDATPQLGGNLDLNGNDITGTGDINTTGTLTVSSNATIGGNATITGDLTVNGTTTTISAENLAIEDSMVYLNDGNTTSNVDLGWAGNYNDGTYAHLGVFADATDSNKFKFYKGYTPEPGSEIDTSHASYTPATVVAGTFEGALTAGDNVKAQFGAGNDLQIYHDGSHSYIHDTGTGNLRLKTNQFQVLSQSTGDVLIEATEGVSGSTVIYHNGTGRVTANSAGVDILGPLDVTGNIVVSGTVDGRDVAADGSKLDGIEANAKDDQTITAGSGLSGGGTGNVTLSHADTSSQASVNNSGNTFIQDITLDTYGHITGLTSSTAVINDGTLTMGTSGTGISGSATFTANDSDNVTFTVSSNATSANTASAIVARDGSGNFSAGTITASLSGNVSGNLTGNVTGNVSGSSGSCTGNAATATKLATARTIGGVSFDGSANINLPGVNTTGNQNTSGSSASCTGNAATATTLQTARTINGVSFNGSANITVEPYISNDDTGDTNCPITFTSNTTAGYKRLYEDSSLYMDNTNNYVYAAQFIASSDRNLKDNIVNVNDAVSKVQKLNGVTFNWKENGKAEAGVIAQDVLEVLPEAVQEHQDGHLSVNYGSLHALLIEAIKEQQVQIEELKAKLGD